MDEQNVNSFAKLSDQDKKDIQITMVLPKQNENGDWLAYGFTSRETLDAYIAKDKKAIKNNINPLGSGAGSTDFYEHKDKGTNIFTGAVALKTYHLAGMTEFLL